MFQLSFITTNHQQHWRYKIIITITISIKIRRKGKGKIKPWMFNGSAGVGAAAVAAIYVQSNNFSSVFSPQTVPKRGPWSKTLTLTWIFKLKDQLYGAALSSFFMIFFLFLSDWGSFAFRSLQKDLSEADRWWLRCAESNHNRIINHS